MDNDLSPEQMREWRELISRPQSVFDLLSNPQFWEFYFFAFCNDKIIREFAETTGLPVDDMVEHIKKKRTEWLKEHLRQTAPYYHRANGTIN